MAKYMYIYKSADDVDMTQLPKEELAKAMQAWGEWLGSMGPKVIDRGDMFKRESKSLGNEKLSESAGVTSGYSIIEASNFDEALELASSCPIITNGGRVEVYEAFGL